MPEYKPVESPDATTLFPYHDLTPPTTADVYRAWQIVRKHLPWTPLVRSEWLSVELDADFDEAREYVEERAAETGKRYVHSANEPALIAGVGTAGLEVLDDCPAVDILVCPVGGGSGTSGYCLTVGAIAGASVIGVQSSAAPAAYQAYTEGHLDPHDEMGTFAEGMATRVPFALPQRILRERLAEMWLVDDDALRDAMRRAIEEEHLLVEGAAAAPIAALLERPDAFAGQTVVLPISGRNVAMDTLQEGLAPSELPL